MTDFERLAQKNGVDLVKDKRLTELKKLLSDTDYIAAKIAEGCATRKDYADVIAQRQAWREEINKLEVCE